MSVHNLAKPTHFAVEFAILARRALFIFPVCRNAVFRHFVHFVSADLDFEGFGVLRHDGGVQGLVVIRFGHCDIVLETSRHRLPHRVDFAKHRVAILHGVNDDSHRQQVVNLVYIDMQIVHFFVHGIKVFGSAVHFAVYAHFFEFFFDLLANCVQKALSFGLLFGNVFRNILVLGRQQIFHCQIFEFALEERNTKSARKRSIDVKRFFCDTFLLFFGEILQRAHIMQTVGKFDDDNSQILCHSNENLSEVFRLRLFSVDKLKFVEFGYALDKFANLVAELLSKFVVSDGRIFQNVMQKRGYDR